MLLLFLQHEEYYFLNYSERRLYTPMFQYEVPSSLLDCEIVPTPLLFKCGAQLFDVAGQRVAESLPFIVENVEIDATQVRFKCLRKNTYQSYNETHFYVQTRTRRCLVDLRCRWHCHERVERYNVRHKLTKLEALDAANKLVQLQLEYRSKVEALMEHETRLEECGRRLQDVEGVFSEYKARAADAFGRLDAIGEKLYQCMQQHQNASALLALCDEQLARSENVATSLGKANENSVAEVQALNLEISRYYALNDEIRAELTRIVQARASEQAAGRLPKEEALKQPKAEPEPVIAETGLPAVQISTNTALSNIIYRISRTTLAAGIVALLGYHWLLLLKGARFNP